MNPQVVPSPDTSSPSVLICGPARYSSTITPPRRDWLDACEKAHAGSVASVSRNTPRAPRPSIGLSTRGKPRSRTTSISACSDSIAWNHGIGTLARRKASFIASLSAASRALSIGMPGRSSAAATPATVIGTSAAMHITPSIGRFVRWYFVAAAIVPSTSSVCATPASSATANPGAFGFMSLTTTCNPIARARWMPGTASAPALTIQRVLSRVTVMARGAHNSGAKVHPSVHVQGLTGNVSGLVAREERDRRCDFVRRRDPSGRDVADLLAAGRRRELLRDHLGRDQSAGDRVGRDALSAVELGQRSREVVESGLRAGVVHLQHTAPLSPYRRDVDDASPPLLQHCEQRFLSARERAPDA